MNTIIFLVMRQMRIPLLVLLTAYAIAIIGLTLVPGIDDQGRIWHMDFFHACYFVSYMSTTIGFGEIPYEFSAAQRFWVMICVYMTVVAWIYAIGALLTSVQDEGLRRAFVHSAFIRTANNIHEPFFLVCGYGDTGQALVSALEEKFLRSVVIEIRQERIDVLTLENYPVYVPALCADASLPDNLVAGGLTHLNCAGIVAVTNDNLVNLKIAITSKLLQPNLTVIGRVDSQEVAANMNSFGTDYLIDPFDIFARKLHTAIQSPHLLLLRECLTGKFAMNRCEPLNPPKQGLWILCGYGRFGKAVYQRFKGEKDIHLVVIEASPEITGYPRGECVVGRGTEADTLRQAHIGEAVGIVAGTDDDVNNLSIIMTARELNPNIFVVIRQNKAAHQIIFEAAKADIVMQASEIIANHIRVLLTTPLLINFLRLAKHQSDDWNRIFINKLKKILMDSSPTIWQTTIEPETTPALCEALSQKQQFQLNCLFSDPRERTERLNCMPLLLDRQGNHILLPQGNEMLELGDQILWCGKSSSFTWMGWTLRDSFILNYLATGEMQPRSYLWRRWQVFKDRFL